MTEYIRKRISINNAKIGMELAEDAISSTGMLLVPKNTKITEKHLFRMSLYQILSVVIKAYDEDPLTPEADNLIPDIPIEVDDTEPPTESYKQYKQAYLNVDANVRNHLNDIATGLPIDEDAMISSVTTLLGSLRLKSDLFNFMNSLHTGDNHTYIHSINVAMLCNIFGQWLKMSEDDIKTLTLSGLIHDIGKTLIDESILNKPGKLSSEEFEKIKTHTTLGYNLIKDQNIPDKAKEAVLLHHERNDGSGYPKGLTKDEIPDFAKIMAIVDVYDAMTSNRTYHEKFSPFKVIQIFEQESYGYLDTKFLFIFLENIAHYYLGETVLLSDGRLAKIVFIHNTTPSRPIVQIEDEMIDLSTNRTLDIEEIV